MRSKLSAFVRAIPKYLQHIAEFLLALIFILASYSEFTYREFAPGALGFLISSDVASITYTVWFALIAIGLLYSKFFKKKKLHKYALMSIYLTTIYTISLSLALFGFAEGAVADDIVIGVVAALCWLRWKFLTEYIDPNKIYSKTLPFRTDLPND